MLILPPFEYRRRRTARGTLVPPDPGPPTPAPVLLTAKYYYDTPSLVLEFDQEIDIAAIQVDQFVVNDNIVYSYTLQGTGTAALLAPRTVAIPLMVTGPNTLLGLLTTASATNGIKSTPNGSNWDGVTDFETQWAN